MARLTESPHHWKVSTRCGLSCASLLMALLAAVSSLRAAAPQDTLAILVRVEDRTRLGARNRVVLRDTKLQADRDIYRSDGSIIGDATPSPDGQYVSILEVVEDAGRAKKQLVILDVSGRVVRAIADKPIVRHIWCCTGRIAVIVGRSFEGGLGFMPEGVSVVDVLTGVEQRLDGVDLPYQLHWAPFDSSLYIKAFPPRGARGPAAVPPVYRYHAPTGRLSLTPRRGVFFAPDGRYYFDPSVEGSEFRLYRTADDQDVTQRLALPSDQIKRGPEFGWMPGAGHVLLFADKPLRPARQPGQRREPARLMDRNLPQVYPDRWNMAVDAETGRVIDRFQGDLGAGWKTNAAALPIERRTGIELIPPRRP